MELDTSSAPDPGGGALVRRRLLRAMVERFDRRVVAVTAPAGFGKTTVLTQALHENLLAPRGVDAWVSLRPRVPLWPQLAAALEIGGQHVPGPAAVVDAMLRHAPLQVALVLDDVHELTVDPVGCQLLADVVEALPSNGHVVFAGRSDPPIALARHELAGRVLRVGEDDLRFTAEELDALAALHRLEAGTLGAAGGWPAMTMLSVWAGPDVARRYLWEEVLDRLGPESRHLLAVLWSVGGADDELLRSVVGADADVDRLVGLPMLHRDADGSVRPHALWGPELAGLLTGEEARALRRRAALVLRERGELARAAHLVLGDVDHDEEWAVVRDLIADCCYISGWVARADLLTSWISALPERRLAEPAGLLLRASTDRLRRVVGDDVRPLLQRALADARTSGQGRIELGALSQLAHIAWWHDDLATLGALYERGVELEAEGWVEARGPVAIGRAMLAQLAHDHDGMLAEIDRVDRTGLDPGMAAGADWLQARALLALGRAEEAIAYADRAVAEPGVAFQAARAEGVLARWFSGRVLEAIARLDAMDVAAEHLPRDRFLLGVVAAGGHALVGDVDRARQYLELARTAAGSVEGDRPPLFLAHTGALVLVAEGDEAAAAELLRAGLGDSPLGPELLDVLRVLLAALYVLLPERREELRSRWLGPDQQVALDAAQALVSARSGTAVGRPAAPERVLGALGSRWTMELACRTGDDELAGFLLDAFGELARVHLRVLATGGPHVLGPEVVSGAKALLKVLPTPPRATLHLRVLGPCALERDGRPVSTADWRRERVRGLLFLLVAHRRVSREWAAAALWPDLDAESAATNLRVTLGYLHKVLEPDRRPNDATWFVRTGPDALELVTDGLEVDAWRMDALLDEAGAAEADGSPSIALVAYRGALDLWRGDYLSDVYDDWAGPERDRLRARFLGASVRTGELLLASGDTDAALRLATRAVETEPWFEPAHRLTLAAHLARGDRASARHALDRCYAALAELGVDPEPATAVFERALLDPS